MVTLEELAWRPKVYELDEELMMATLEIIERGALTLYRELDGLAEAAVSSGQE